MLGQRHSLHFVRAELVVYYRPDHVVALHKEKGGGLRKSEAGAKFG